VTEERLVIIAIPPLVALLLALEKQKGAPLTEEAVIAIRDRAACMAVPESEAALLTEKRGYSDIALEKAWEEWSAIRPSLSVDDR
jgi:hypothetical protein